MDVKVQLMIVLIEKNGNCISEEHEVGTVGIESLEVLATIQIHVWL